MKQSKRMSLLESLINIAVGFSISLAAQVYFLPLLGVVIDLRQNLAFALIMTAISIARSFALRRLFEALHIRRPLTPAMVAVIAERYRQVEVEGFDVAHDDKQEIGALAAAGACYVLNAVAPERYHGAPPASWPWERRWWQPQGFWRDLVRGAALILAEMERALRRRRAPASTIRARWAAP